MADASGAGTQVDLDLGSIISLEDAVAYIVAAGSSDPDQDDVLLHLLAASDAIRDQCNRHFTVPTVVEARTFPVFGDTTIYAEELVSVTAVKDVDGNELEHTVMPGEREGDHVRWIDLATASDDYVVIEGTWGWEVTPQRAQHACRVATRLWFIRDLSTMTTVLDTQTGFIERPSTLPKIVIGLLEKLVWRHPL